jgi:hypothetical protein
VGYWVYKGSWVLVFVHEYRSQNIVKVVKMPLVKQGLRRVVKVVVTELLGV